MSFSTQRWRRRGDKRREREIKEGRGGGAGKRQRKEMKIGQHERTDGGREMHESFTPRRINK